MIASVLYQVFGKDGTQHGVIGFVPVRKQEPKGKVSTGQEQAASFQHEEQNLHLQPFQNGIVIVNFKGLREFKRHVRQLP